jgi:DNA polymerase-3 subunit gamma/tau
MLPRAPLVSAPVVDPAAQQSPLLVHALHASAASATAGAAHGASPNGPAAAPRGAVLPMVPERVGEPRPEPAMIERVVGAAAGGGDGHGDARIAAGPSGASAMAPAWIASPPAQPPAGVTTPVVSDARGRRSRMGAPLVQRQAPQVALRTAPIESTLADPPGATRPDLGRSRPAPRGVIVRGRAVAPVAPSPSSTEIELARPTVAPRRSPSVDAPRAVTVVPRHNAVPTAGVGAPVVVPPQPSPAARGTAGPSLAHLAPAATAPTADRGGPALAAPRVDATVPPPHRPITGRGPAGATASLLDLRQIAAGVQQIFARQAEHERARRGTRR